MIQSVNNFKQDTLIYLTNQGSAVLLIFFGLQLVSSSLPLYSSSLIFTSLELSSLLDKTIAASSSELPSLHICSISASSSLDKTIISSSITSVVCLVMTTCCLQRTTPQNSIPFRVLEKPGSALAWKALITNGYL